MKRSVAMALVSVTCACALIPASAQWTRQTIALNPGWNAVHIDIDPLPQDCGEIFAGVPIESVWAWNRSFRSVQFLQNPDELLPTQPEWRTFFPAGHPQAFLNNLFTLRAGHTYLIKLADNATAVELKLTGRAVPPSHEWYPDSYSLVGFPVSDGAALTFSEYFAASAAHKPLKIYTLARDGTWQRIAEPATTAIERGRAYWVWCDGPSDYAGPIVVALDGKQAVEFGSGSNNDEVQLRNIGSSSRACTIRVIASAPPPIDAGAAALAGPLRLDYYNASYDPQRFAWDPFPASLERTLSADGTWTLVFSLRRAELPHAANALYQSVLEVTDARGLRILVPMTAEGMGATADETPLPRPGLWVGTVMLDGVSEVNGSPDPQPTSAPFSFRLIVHQDSNGVARLLSEATEVVSRKSGATVPMILSDGRTLSQYVQPHDAGSIAARFSSAVFGFRGMRTLNYSAGSATLSLTLTLGYDDALNPFKHLYHPDHDNLQNYRTRLPEGDESYTVTRAISMAFTSTPVPGAPVSGWGDTLTGGNYSESVNGLYHSTLKTSGRFVLRHVSDVTILE